MTMQTVLITGAASGIGREAARAFAAAGWRCVLVDFNEAALQQLTRSLPCLADALHLLRHVDLTDAEQIASMAEGLPALDAIINNAGMSDASNTPLANQTYEHMTRLLALNLHAPARVVEACASLLAPCGRIVNVSSGAGLHAIPWRGAYSPSKAGLIAQTQALAQARPEWCVSALAPGFVRTELVDGLIQAGRIQPANAVAKIPLGRMASPAEMAQALVFLAGHGAAPLHGGVLSFDGGSSIFGGSHRFEPTTLEPLPLESTMRLDIRGGEAKAWQEVAPFTSTSSVYDACLDLSPLACKGPGLLQAVHEAAVRFSASHAQQASLTLLLPPIDAGRWQDAGDAAAARMLVATLACEWGSRALRINALQVPDVLDPQALHALLRFVCGPAAQYLTGQTIVCHDGKYRGAH